MRAYLVWMLLTATSSFAGLSKLEALSMIETGNNDAAIGCVGEVSRFQIRPEVWRQYTASRDFNNAQIAALVAEQHVRYLENFFRTRTGREPTDFDLYVLWNAGAGYYGRINFSPDRVHHRISERAYRYVNLRQMELPKDQQRVEVSDSGKRAAKKS